MDNEQIELLSEYLFKHFSDEEIEQLIKNYKPEQLRKKLAEIDIEFFAKMYFPDIFELPFAEYHCELYNEYYELLEKNDARTVIACPRGYSKSTNSTFLFPIWCAAYKKVRFILIVAATEQIAAPFLEQIKNAIEENNLIKSDFGNLKDDKKWNANQIWLTNGVCITIRGIDGGIRGLLHNGTRPDLMIFDDLLKDSVVKSERANEEIKNTFYSAAMKAGSKNCKFLMVGTVLSEDDLISELLSYKTTRWKQIKKSAVIKFSDSPLWETWKALYKDYSLTPMEREQLALQFFEDNKEEMLAGTKVLWEANRDYYNLMLELMDNPVSFWKELQNEPKNVADYPLQNIKYWDKLPDIDDMEIILFADPSVGKTQNADYSAFVTVGKHKKTGQMFVLDGLLAITSQIQFIDTMIEKIDRFPTATIYGESNGFQYYLMENLQNKLIEKGYYDKVINPFVTPPTSNKKDRIMTLQPMIENGSLLFNPNNHIFNDDIKNYNKNARRDDGPDALSLALQQLIPKKSSEFKLLKFKL